MFDKFDEYMQYLLPSAFKRQKKQNQLLVYCKVIGRLYDSLLQSILRLREETIIATCSPEMLDTFGNDYDMPRMQGETDDMYRKRLQMKALVAETAGTQKGILYALASVGYDNCSITPFYLTDPERWAEIRINIFTPDVDVDNPIAFKCVVAEVLKVKQAGTLPHWRFYYPVHIWHTDINRIRAAVRFVLYVQFWRDIIYNGQYYYDGTLQYNAKRNYKTNTMLVNHMYLHTKQHTRCIGIDVNIRLQGNNVIKVAIRSHYNISYWGCPVYDGDWRYNGILRYDAKRRYAARMSLINRFKACERQAVVYRHNRLRIRVRNTDIMVVRFKSHKHVIQNPKPVKKCRIRIHIEVRGRQEKIENVYVETRRNVIYYNGTLRYNGTAKYNALYRKEEVE